MENQKNWLPVHTTLRLAFAKRMNMTGDRATVAVLRRSVLTKRILNILIRPLGLYHGLSTRWRGAQSLDRNSNWKNILNIPPAEVNRNCSYQCGCFPRLCSITDDSIPSGQVLLFKELIRPVDLADLFGAITGNVLLLFSC
jgi:hypothetical protein